MVATVIIEEITGAFGSETFTEKNTDSNSRYYTADSHLSGSTSNPIPIPNDTDGGLSGSYWKTHLLSVTSEADVRIENVRFYVGWTSPPSSQWTLGPDGDHIIGVSSASVSDCKIFTQGFPSSQYDQAEGVEGSFGYFLSGNVDGTKDHTYYSGCSNGHYESTWNFSSQATAMMVYSGQVKDNTTGRLSGCIVTQVLVGSGATQGEKADVTATWVYDEV